MMERFKKYARKKSVIGTLSVLAVTGTIVGTQFNKSPEPTRYVVAAVSRGTLITTVSGSGQVSGLNQVDLKPSVSGAITKILVKTGDKVKADTPLMEIDRKTANKTVRDAAQSVNDARLSLDLAQMAYDKLKQPVETLTLIQAQNSVNQARRNLDSLKDGPDAIDVKQAENDLKVQQQNSKLAADGVTPQTVRNALDNVAPVIKTTAQAALQALYDADEILGNDDRTHNITYANNLGVYDGSRLPMANSAYLLAKPSVTAFKQLADGLLITGESQDKIKAAIDQGQASLALLEPLLQKVSDVLDVTMTNTYFTPSNLDTLKNTIQGDHNDISGKISTLNTQRQAVDQAQTTYATALLNVEKAQNSLDKLKAGTASDDLISAEERLAEAQASYNKLTAGATAYDLAQAENSLAQRRSSLASARNRLTDAQETLNDYTVRAPFDGVIAKISAHVADQASNGTAVATLLTETKLAQVSLNEVDVAKIKNEQKAMLTFDAVPDLTIAGMVSEVDAIGTVSQGVVTYNVKIAFITQDERIKTGMSVSAAIATNVLTDALLVPNAAVKTTDNGSTVQTLKNIGADAANNSQGVTSDVAPTTQTVQIGLANDQNTAITSGLKEGDYIVTRTIDAAAAALAKSTKTSTQSSSMRIPGMGGFGGAGR